MVLHNPRYLFTQQQTYFTLPKIRQRYFGNGSFPVIVYTLLLSVTDQNSLFFFVWVEAVYERSGKYMFWPIKNSGEVFSKLKDIGYQATSLSTYDFSTLYTTLPHYLITS